MPLLAGVIVHIGTELLVPLSQLTKISRFDLRQFFDQTFLFIAYLSIGTLLLQNLVISSTALRLASTTISREKQGHTWESLITTTLTAWRMVIGKWWAVIRALWSQFAWTLVARGILGGWLILNAERSGFTSHADADLLVPAITLILFPLINAAFAAALGVFASTFIASDAAATRVTGLIQAGLLLVVLGVGCLLMTFLFAPDADTSSIFFPAITLIVTPLDGGLISLMALISSPRGVDDNAAYFTGIGIWIASFTVSTVLILAVARRLLIRQGVLRR